MRHHEKIMLPLIGDLSLTWTQVDESDHLLFKVAKNEENAPKWKRVAANSIVWISEKLKIARFYQKRDFITEVGFSYITVSEEDLIPLVQRQINEIVHEGLIPDYVVMGHADLYKLKEEEFRDPRNRNTYLDDRATLTPPIALQYGNQVRILTHQLKNSRSLSNVMNEVGRNFRSFPEVFAYDNPHEGTISFEARTIFSLPILVLPWVQGVFVVPKTQRQPVGINQRNRWD